MSIASIRRKKRWNGTTGARATGVKPSLLQLYSILGGLPKTKLARVAAESECQLIPAGNTIYCQEDDADAVYLLLDGDVRLERFDGDGEAIAHRVHGPFASFGDVALIGESQRYYTANTTSQSVVIRTPLTVLREVLANNPALAEAWIHAVTADLKRRERKLADSVIEHIASPAFFDAA